MSEHPFPLQLTRKGVFMAFSRGEIIEIPAAVDVHSHFREPGGEHKETILSGTRAALHGGYVLTADMPNNPGTKEDPKANQTLTSYHVLRKEEIAEATAQTDLVIIGGHDFDNPRIANYTDMVQLVRATKGYFGHTTGNTKETTIEDSSVWASYTAWDEEAKRQSYRTTHMLHAQEEVGYFAARRIMQELGAPVHWCHVSTAKEVDYAMKLEKQQPELFTYGITPHHLLMTGRNATYLNGWMARMVPKLGSEVDQDKLLWAFANSKAIVETDHAPHTTDEKMKAEADNPHGHMDVGCTACFGVSGIEFALPMLTRLVQQGIVSMERFVDATHYGPLRVLGLSDKTRYENAHTVLEFEPWQITPDALKGRSSNTPYLGAVASSRVIRVDVYGKDWLAQKKPDTMVVRPERIAI